MPNTAPALVWRKVRRFMADEDKLSQCDGRDEFPSGEPFQRGRFPLLPERAFAAVEAVAAGGEFEEFDGDVVRLHRSDELAAVLDAVWDIRDRQLAHGLVDADELVAVLHASGYADSHGGG